LLSEAGFNMHLNNIDHSTNMYNVHGGQANLDSVENSKAVLFRNFQKQQEEIKRLRLHLGWDKE